MGRTRVPWDSKPSLPLEKIQAATPFHCGEIAFRFDCGCCPLRAVTSPCYSRS
jgi:hypothetical protein